MSFGTFDLAHDVASLVSSINEVVAISSSIFATDSRVKFFTNIASGSSTDLGGYWETVYDSSPTSSLSTPLFDVTFGYSTGSAYLVAATLSSSINEKVKIYRQFASALLGDQDAKFTVNGVDLNEAFFISIKRGIQKDEIKKGSVSIPYNIDAGAGPNYPVTASDSGAVTSFKQTVGGDYANLFAAAAYSGARYAGTVWYNAGVIVLNPASFKSTMGDFSQLIWSGSKYVDNLMASGSINNLSDGLRKNLSRIDFHNQTNMFSTVYFCRATNTEFNYSSNPTFVDDNKRIRVTSGSNVLQTRTYVTTIGLYDASDNLLAAAKVNKPITKSPDSEAIFRLRLDY